MPTSLTLLKASDHTIHLSDVKLFTSEITKANSASYSGHESFNDFEKAVIPLKRAGNLILMEGTVDGREGNLILDTGSSAVVLNGIYFREGNQGPTVMSGGITGSATAVRRSRADSIQIAGLGFSRVEANVADLGHIEQARNIRVLGFFGLALFVNCEVVIDLSNNVMEIYRLDYRGRRLTTDEATNFDVEINATVESSVFFIDAQIDNRKLMFCLDTGAESNVLGSHLPGKVLNSVAIARRANLRGAGTETVEVLFGTLEGLIVSGQNIDELNVLITNLNAMSNYFGVRIDGMLGTEFLQLGIFSFNLKQKKLGIVFHPKE